MEFLNFIGEENLATFMLLFARLSGLVLFFPFFSHNTIPITIKTTLALFLTIYLFPLAQLENSQLNGFFIIQILSELLLGLIAGLALQMIFGIILMASEQIAFAMGFTMASVMDPGSGINMPVISQILYLLALLFFLAFDGHHLVLLFLSETLTYIKLGVFYPSMNFMIFLNEGMFKLFMLGFCVAFPVIGLNLLSDMIFGFLMKTMPQFNLLVIGYPIKIALAFFILILILLVLMQNFKGFVLEFFTNLRALFLI